MFIACAQTTSALTEPEFADVVFGLDGSKLLPLERETVAVKMKAGGYVFVGTVTGFIEIPGGKSQVRLRGGRAMEFVVRTANREIDPAGVYQLHMLIAKKNKRQAVTVTGRVTALGSSSVNTKPTDDIIPVQFTHYGSASYKITTPPLAPGEYAFGFGHPGAMDVFCFGVD